MPDINALLGAITALAQAVRAGFEYQMAHEASMTPEQRQQAAQQALDMAQIFVDLLNRLPKLPAS